MLCVCALLALGLPRPAAAQIAGADPLQCEDDSDCASGFCLDGLCLEDIGETPAFSLPTPTPTPTVHSDFCPGSGASCDSSDSGGSCSVGPPTPRDEGLWLVVPAALVWWRIRRRRA